MQILIKFDFYMYNNNEGDFAPWLEDHNFN